jgi:hypothetical protein
MAIIRDEFSHSSITTPHCCLPTTSKPPFASSVNTSNPFKPRPPMSDENETNNPYQAPTLSDEPLVRKGADGPKTRLNRVHWLVPILGYAYVPAIFISGSLADYVRSQGLYSIRTPLIYICHTLMAWAYFVLPVYVVIIMLLWPWRNRQGTNTRGLKLYHGLSLILPLLWISLLIFLVSNGPWTV